MNGNIQCHLQYTQRYLYHGRGSERVGIRGLQCGGGGVDAPGASRHPERCQKLHSGGHALDYGEKCQMEIHQLLYDFYLLTALSRAYLGLRRNMLNESPLMVPSVVCNRAIPTPKVGDFRCAGYIYYVLLLYTSYLRLQYWRGVPVLAIFGMPERMRRRGESNFLSDAFILYCYIESEDILYLPPCLLATTACQV